MSIHKDQLPLTTPPSDLDHHLGYLKLSFIAGHYAELATQAVPKQWSHIDYLDRLVEGEAQVRRDRATKSRIRLARFPVTKTVDPMFKGVWSTAVNFVLVPPPDTKLAQ